MPLKRGDIVLLSFPWTDLQGEKVRPALVVSDDSYNKTENDSVFLFITTKKGRGSFDFRLTKSHSSFQKTGLKKASTFRIGKIVSLEQKLARRRLGHADAVLLKKIKSGLKVLLDI